MELTKERTDWIITDGADITGIYQHVVLVYVGKAILEQLNKYKELAEGMKQHKSLRYLAFDGSYGYLLKTRERTEDHFPGWTDLVGRGDWSYLKMTDERMG